MENASKALFIAAGVFLGTLIITVAVYLFNVFGTNSKDIQEKMSQKEIAEFNNQFLKYYGERPGEGGNPEPIKCTIHDIVSLVNLAKEYSEYDIAICVDNTNITNVTQDQLIKYINQMDLEKITNDDGEEEYVTVYFKCTEVDYNGQIINYMNFMGIR